MAYDIIKIRQAYFLGECIFKGVQLYIKVEAVDNNL